MNEEMHKAIQVRAYFLWLEAGCPDDQAVLHWLQAEAEAEAELGLNPKVDETELARAADLEEDPGSERPPAGEPYG
jgi:hypothetical protein